MNLDRPTSWEHAIEQDKLGRTAFAEAVANTLRHADASGGLVVSVEGDWGSGKTFTLSLIEARLRGKELPPVIVHFNPWLVGERDALLRQFLNSIANAIQAVDQSESGKRAAKEIKAYAKVFDVLKLVPGAEPWTSMIKSVVEAVGDATNAVAEHKAPDIEGQKARVEDALRGQHRTVAVFIDDVDRLYPAEVFEMIRIIKAVGDLPFVAYALAWDSAYVSKALEGLGVPFANIYLDKIVQVRMPLPVLSAQARETLVNAALDALPTEAGAAYFPNQEERLTLMYQYGIRRLLEHPRDITRLFNAVEQIEPLLRGEIVLADIIGFASLIIKAPEVDQLIRKQPSLFVPGADEADTSFDEAYRDTGERNEGRKQRVERALEKALADHPNPTAVLATVCQLFPFIAEILGRFSYVHASFAEGSIGHPTRLPLALQLMLTKTDVSIRQAHRFLKHAAERSLIIESLTPEKRAAFITALSELIVDLTETENEEIVELALHIARIPDSPGLTSIDKNSGWLAYSSSSSALRVIHSLARKWPPEDRSSLASRIVGNASAISCAAELVADNFISGRRTTKADFKLSEGDKAGVLNVFGANVLSAAQSGALFETEHPGWTLAVLGQTAPNLCPPILDACAAEPKKLDKFAVALLARVKDSHKGQAYGLSPNEPMRSAYGSVEELQRMAAARLSDPTLDRVAGVAWRAVLQDKTLYGKDGSVYRE